MEQKSTPNKRARIHMRRRAVLAVRNYHQPEQLKLNMEIKEDALSAAVPEVLDKGNYVAWSVQVKTYLMAHDLWDVVEATTEPPKKEDDEAAFKAWSNKNSMALHVLQVSCGLYALSMIRQISWAKIAWNTLAVVLQVLEDEDNYVDWSVRVKTYMMAHDLWDIVEGTTEPPIQEDDEAAFKAWTKKNSTALHIIQISCGPDTFSEIIQISSAEIAWDMLAKKFLQFLEEDTYEEWSVRVKTYLMAHDLWDIIEETTKPPKQEDDEAAFKAWSKKNSTALHVLQVSCMPHALFVIRQINLAKIAWNTLAVVLEVLENEDNYVNWSIRVKSYLMAHDLWEVIEATTEPPKQEVDEAAFTTWSKKNSTALHVIQISCGQNALSVIIEISSPKTAWNTLAKKYKGPTGGDSDDEYVQYEALKKAVRIGEWNAVEEFLKLKPGAASAKITYLEETALYVAVRAGHEHIVKKLVDVMSEEDLEIQNKFGNTALSFAIAKGNYRMAEFMVGKNKNLVIIKDQLKGIPVIEALDYGHKELARYLYSITPLENLMPEKGTYGATLCAQAIRTGTFDIALDLIHHCPRLALALDNEGSSPLYTLASMPFAFPSRNRLVFWKQWIYSCIHIQSACATKEIRLNIQSREERQSDQVKMIQSVLALLRQLVMNLLNLLGIKDLYEMKFLHVQSRELLHCMCKELPPNIKEREKGRVYDAIFQAIEKGIFEFVFDIVRTNPELLWTYDKDKRNIFLIAVLHRQAKIFSLIYGLDEKNVITNNKGKSGNQILHMAGFSANSTQLNRIPGAALQMQRELQWYKEVESIVHPKVKESTNKDGFTPRQLFTEKHKDMMQAGEKWMKDTSSSCTVVAALIVTIMFAAAFTVPGGNNQNTGFPMFLNEKMFRLFIISDALSLFSSSTSMLIFLGILTSRYAEEDFLKSLPTKMIIGLSTLFFSIATMMIAFSAGILIMLQGQSWHVIPVICLASVPVTLFIWMQFPLLVDMSISTFGPNIFDRKMKQWV